MKKLINNIPIVNSFYAIWSSPLESKHIVTMRRKRHSSRIEYAHKVGHGSIAMSSRAESSKAFRVS